MEEERDSSVRKRAVFNTAEQSEGGMNTLKRQTNEREDQEGIRSFK